jgi:subtilisin family serine protease
LTSGAKVLYALNGSPNEDGFDVTLNDYAANRENDPFPIPDHGVFVAAAAAQVAGWQHMTLHSSVPSLGDDENLAAESNGLIQMESVRVLGEYGVGDTYQLVRQLERIADSIQPNEKVIVNLSLVINTPPEGFAVRRLFGADSGKNPADLHVALHKAIDRLYKKGKGALIIAAAGNSSAGEAGRERALYPAAFDEVLAVTAATPDGTKEAYYANRVYSKGVAVFGGTVKKDVASGKLVVDEKFPLDGPFTDSKVPVFGEDPDNDSGQVLWAGTSFATPRVAGLAARIWLAEPELSAGDVRAKVQALATGKLQCGTPYIDLAKKAEKADA